eukprot:7950815-Pyramimonas_sp.AAC.1
MKSNVSVNDNNDKPHRGPLPHSHTQGTVRQLGPLRLTLQPTIAQTRYNECVTAAVIRSMMICDELHQHAMWATKEERPDARWRRTSRGRLRRPIPRHP